MKNDQITDVLSKKLIDAKEAALILNVSISHIYHLLQSETLRSVRIGGSVRILPDDLQKFILAQIKK